MTTTINASPTNGIVQTADGSGVLKVQSNGVTTNALAWARFNPSSGSAVLVSSYNVSSVTYSATGYFVVNFTTALSDANYSAVASASADPGTYPCLAIPYTVSGANYQAPTTASFSMNVIRYNGTNTNPSSVNVAVFGN